MEKNRKKIRISYYCIAIALAFALGASKSAFDLSDTVFITLYWLLMIGIVATFFIINGLWLREFWNGIQSLQPILFVEKDPDRYITEIEKLLVGKKSEHLKGLLRINLSTAYCQKGDFEEAKRQLLAVKTKKIRGVNRVILFADLAYVEFCLENNEAALAYMKQNKRGIKDFENHPHLGALIAILHIFELLSNGEHDKAQELYDNSRKLWENDITKSDFDILKQRLE